MSDFLDLLKQAHKNRWNRSDLKEALRVLCDQRKVLNDLNRAIMSVGNNRSPNLIQPLTIFTIKGVRYNIQRLFMRLDVCRLHDEEQEPTVLYRPMGLGELLARIETTITNLAPIWFGTEDMSDFPNAILSFLAYDYEDAKRFGFVLTITRIDDFDNEKPLDLAYKIGEAYGLFQKCSRIVYSWKDMSEHRANDDHAIDRWPDELLGVMSDDVKKYVTDLIGRFVVDNDVMDIREMDSLETISFDAFKKRCDDAMARIAALRKSDEPSAHQLFDIFKEFVKKET